jgi:hypothetical protein
VVAPLVAARGLIQTPGQPPLLTNNNIDAARPAGVVFSLAAHVYVIDLEKETY